MTMTEEETGADLKTNKIMSQCRELNSGPLPYQVTVVCEKRL